jgi:hypothetical protein
MKHPRVGGEDNTDHEGKHVDLGTPPRRRGGPDCKSPDHPSHRNTPASAEDEALRPFPGERSAPASAGGLSNSDRVPRVHRSTPASAGRPRSSAATSSSSTEHPRVGGDGPTPAPLAGQESEAPPRRRGGQPGQDAVRALPRSTPASAGRTPRPSPRPPRQPKHPRVGGEDTASSSKMMQSPEAPPRRRGGQDMTRRAVRAVRNTPASAGRTWGSALCAVVSAEHPRVGGEDESPRSRPPSWYEAPPRRRGGRRSATRRSPRTRRIRRVGGEDGWWVLRTPKRRGTPPRRRGGRHRSVLWARATWNTPASAGRTTTRTCGGRSPPKHPRVGGEDALGSGQGTGRSEHPRVGGEDPVTGAWYMDDWGTPPRRRGGRPAFDWLRTKTRSTPASAGRTTGPGRTGGPSSKHPRVGGEDLTALRIPVVTSEAPPRRRGGRGDAEHGPDPRRSTPASAGRTSRPTLPATRTTDHPRVGREDQPSSPSSSRRNEAPPRRRGGRHPREPARRDVRSTPASAGRMARFSWDSRADAEHPRVGGEDLITM